MRFLVIFKFRFSIIKKMQKFLTDLVIPPGAEPIASEEPKMIFFGPKRKVGRPRLLSSDKPKKQKRVSDFTIDELAEKYRRLRKSQRLHSLNYYRQNKDKILNRIAAKKNTKI
jgi:hypothetical protein